MSVERIGQSEAFKWVAVLKMCFARAHRVLHFRKPVIIIAYKLKMQIKDSLQCIWYSWCCSDALHYAPLCLVLGWLKVQRSSSSMSEWLKKWTNAWQNVSGKHLIFDCFTIEMFNYRQYPVTRITQLFFIYLLNLAFLNGKYAIISLIHLERMHA